METETKRHPEYQYLDMAKHIVETGLDKPASDRTSKQRRYINDESNTMVYDLSEGFPLLTTKRVAFKGITHELIWFLRGDTNIKYLVDNNVHIWDEWGYQRYHKTAEKLFASTVQQRILEQQTTSTKPLTVRDVHKIHKAVNMLDPKITQDEYIQKIASDAEFAQQWGDLGPVYGAQWRRWPASDGREIDQLGRAIKLLQSPTQRMRNEILVSAWNPEYIYEMALPGKSMQLAPCHTLFQFLVRREDPQALDGSTDKLNLHLTQRSGDMFLGVPFNIASYAELTMVIAKITNMMPGKLIHKINDAHVYEDHFDQVYEQCSREPRTFPQLLINSAVVDVDKLSINDFTLEGYNPHPAIKGDVTAEVGGYGMD